MHYNYTGLNFKMHSKGKIQFEDYKLKTKLQTTNF